MYVIRMASGSYPGMPTFLDGNADRLALTNCNIQEFLKSRSPNHIFLTKIEALKAWQESIQIVGSDDYVQKIERKFWIRHGESAREKLEDYINALLNRMARAEIVPLSTLGRAK